MEEDNEVKGDNNSLDFGARIYDPRVGRWMSVDPLFKQFPSWSPYNLVLNNPLNRIDPDGRSPWKPIGDGQWEAEAGDGAESLAR